MLKVSLSGVYEDNVTQNGKVAYVQWVYTRKRK